MAQGIPEGIISSAPGLEAAEKYPQDFEGYKSEQKLPIEVLISDLAGKDDSVVVATLMHYEDKGMLTRDVANSVIDQIAILRAQHELSV